jgi:hypothetical protein
MRSIELSSAAAYAVQGLLPKAIPGKNSVHRDYLPFFLYDGLGHDGPLLGRASGVKSLTYPPIL